MIPEPPPRTALMRVPPRRVPVRVLPPKSLRVVRNTPARIRVENGGTDLGALPLAAAAIPSIKSLATKAISSVIAIVDPGKKREANRKARAQMWGDFARAGSITAARRVLGGSRVQYTPTERGYYQTQWNSLMAAEPRLANQALVEGPLGVPEPGSDVAPPFIPDEDVAALQREVDFYRNPETAALPATTSTALVPVKANTNALLALGLVGAFLATRR